MAEALRCVTSLPGDSSSRISTILLCTDSLSGLQLLSRGPADQQTVLAQEVWTLLNAIVDGGKSIALQWVPGHADIEGNEAADRIANQAAATCDQSTAPVDLSSARTAIRRWSSGLAKARAHRHPHLQRTPGHDDLDRWGQVTVSQLRTGYSPLVRATLHRIGLATDPLCRECGEEDTVEHLLCPTPSTPRRGAGSGDTYPPSTRCSQDRLSTSSTTYGGWGGRQPKSIRPRLPRPRARYTWCAAKEGRKDVTTNPQHGGLNDIRLRPASIAQLSDGG